VTDRGVVRRLAAIMVADAVGYSRWMEADELATHRQFKLDLSQMFLPMVEAYRGRLVKTTGDGLFVEFGSVVDAARCAAEVQTKFRARDAAIPIGRRLLYRIGINVGDIIVEDNDIYGEDVNTAARLEAMAPPGGIAISANVVRSLRGKLDLDLEDMGDQPIKGTDDPVRVYRVRIAPHETGGESEPSKTAVPKDPVLLKTTAPVTPRANGRPAIVVLPFDNLNRDPVQDYFCDGLTSDITTDLSKFSNLLVIAANTAFTYKGKAVNIQELGRDLGVRYVLEGSVQRATSRVRVNAQLIDGASGHHLWAERYDRPAADFLDVQDDIIHRIVSALAIRLTALERERVMQKNPVDPSAYELYLQGVHAYSIESREKFDACRNFFEQATRRDPNFARAWGYFAYMTARGVLLGWLPASAMDEAEQLAKKAIGLDPYDHGNYWDMAFIHYQRGRFDQAMDDYEKALKLNSNDADLLAEVADLHTSLGDCQKAIDQLLHAMRLNPNVPDWYRWNLGWAYYNSKQYQQAIDEIDRMMELPDHARLIKAAAYERLGLHDRASELVTHCLANDPAYSIEKLRMRTPFKDPKAESHWLDAVRQAGLPEG
jgi:TolB-like protein/class 3 adenylate cyclase/Tfp pilus assembly protein PilF